MFFVSLISERKKFDNFFLQKKITLGGRGGSRGRWLKTDNVDKRGYYYIFFVYLDCGYQQKYSFSLTVITRILEKLYLWAWQCVKYYKRHSNKNPHSTSILKIPYVHRIWTSDLCFLKIHIQTRIQRNYLHSCEKDVTMPLLTCICNG